MSDGGRNGCTKACLIRFGSGSRKCPGAIKPASRWIIVKGREIVDKSLKGWKPARQALRGFRHDLAKTPLEESVFPAGLGVEQPRDNPKFENAGFVRPSVGGVLNERKTSCKEALKEAFKSNK